MKREVRERIKRNAARRDPNVRLWNIERMQARGQHGRAWMQTMLRNTMLATEFYLDIGCIYPITRARFRG